LYATYGRYRARADGEIGAAKAATLALAAALLQQIQALKAALAAL